MNRENSFTKSENTSEEEKGVYEEELGDIYIEEKNSSSEEEHPQLKVKLCEKKESIHNLCDDVLVVVFSFLSIRELYYMGWVCSRFRMISSSNVLWESKMKEFFLEKPKLKIPSIKKVKKKRTSSPLFSSSSNSDLLSLELPNNVHSGNFHPSRIKSPSPSPMVSFPSSPTSLSHRKQHIHMDRHSPTKPNKTNNNNKKKKKKKKKKENVKENISISISPSPTTSFSSSRPKVSLLDPLWELFHPSKKVEDPIHYLLTYGRPLENVSKKKKNFLYRDYFQQVYERVDKKNQYFKRLVRLYKFDRIIEPGCSFTYSYLPFCFFCSIFLLIIFFCVHIGMKEWLGDQSLTTNLFFIFSLVCVAISFLLCCVILCLGNWGSFSTGYIQFKVRKEVEKMNKVKKRISLQQQQQQPSSSSSSGEHHQNNNNTLSVSPPSKNFHTEIFGSRQHENPLDDYNEEMKRFTKIYGEKHLFVSEFAHLRDELQSRKYQEEKVGPICGLYCLPCIATWCLVPFLILLVLVFVGHGINWIEYSNIALAFWFCFFCFGYGMNCFCTFKMLETARWNICIYITYFVGWLVIGTLIFLICLQYFCGSMFLGGHILEAQEKRGFIFLVFVPTLLIGCIVCCMCPCSTLIAILQTVLLRIRSIFFAATMKERPFSFEDDSILAFVFLSFIGVCLCLLFAPVLHVGLLFTLFFYFEVPTYFALIPLLPTMCCWMLLFCINGFLVLGVVMA